MTTLGDKSPRDRVYIVEIPITGLHELSHAYSLVLGKLSDRNSINKYEVYRGCIELVRVDFVGDYGDFEYTAIFQVTLPPE